MMKEMVGGCCVCSDDRGWAENPLVYCDGQGCTVAVHQACYGIVTVPTGNWYCRKCESPERTVKRCELCPSRDGALKPTDNSGWAHVVCALYIPEVRFGNVTTMEPIILQQIPQERFNKSCYICEEGGKGSRAAVGACMQCNKTGCRQQFHVTCAQGLGLLCEEAGNYMDNVKYCGYCHHHYNKLKTNDFSEDGSSNYKEDGRRLSFKMKKGGNVKTIPPYRPVLNDSPGDSPSQHQDSKVTKRKLRGGKTPPRASPDPSSSPRPLTPGKPTPPPAQATNSSPPSGSKPGAIVVQVPLEAAIGAGGSGQPHAGSPPSADQPTDLPAKRARSQSSDKSEKGRRSKRGAGSSKTRANQPTPPPGSSPSTTPLVAVKERQSPVEETLESSQRTRKGGSMAVKEEKDQKIMQNGVTGAPHMLGNQLNTSSTMAQKMCDTLSQEVAAHSIFSTEPNLSTSTSLVPPQLPKSSSSSSSSTNNNRAWNSNGGVAWNSSIPQSLDQLLERQWEQGSQFLMEQAQHFDIASLLSCLHQLRAENAQLEEHVNSLLARRDHLLAVNARLAIPLVPPQVGSVHNLNSVGGTGVAGGDSKSVTGVGAAVVAAQPSVVAPAQTSPAPGPARVPVVENGLASPAEQQYLQQRTASTTRSGGGGSSGGGGVVANSSCYSTAPITSSTPSSVVVRGTDPSTLHRRPVVASGGGVVPPQQQPGVVYPSTIYSPQSQPSTSQQPQVVLRREPLQEAGGSGLAGVGAPSTVVPAPKPS